MEKANNEWVQATKEHDNDNDETMLEKRPLSVTNNSITRQSFDNMTGLQSNLLDEDLSLLKLKELRRKSFRYQATWFLNVSSAGASPEKCEFVRRIEQKCNEIESSNDGESVLDEFTAHRLLEYSNNACTVPEFRAFVEGIYGSKKRRVSLAELLIYIFDDDWKKLVDSPDCYDLIAERRASENLEELKLALKKLIDTARDGAIAVKDARREENNAIEKEQEAMQAIEAARNAELSSRDLLEKNKIRMKSLEKLEETTKSRRTELEAIVADSNKGIVTRNKANAELAILLSEDPMSLRTARIKQEATIRKSSEAFIKSKDAVVHFEQVLRSAKAARTEATELMKRAIASSKTAENAIPAAQLLFDKANHALEEIREKNAGGRGNVFFLQADLNEQRRLLPKSQFVIAQKRADEALRKSISISSS